MTTRSPVITDNKMARGKLKNLSNGNQDNLATSEPNSPTTLSSRLPNTLEKQNLSLKPYFWIMMEIFEKWRITPLNNYRRTRRNASKNYRKTQPNR